MNDVIIVGLTGKRRAGKSTIADMLVKNYGFTKVHGFGPGKVMCMAYYQHLGIDQETAFRLIYGDLKDVPHHLLPGDKLSRTFMEKLGYHMGHDMGSEYTLGAEVDRLKRMTGGNMFVAESIVYEAPYIQHGKHNKIIRVTRPETVIEVTGLHSDSVQAVIEEDYEILNTGYSLSELEVRVTLAMKELYPTLRRLEY